MLLKVFAADSVCIVSFLVSVIPLYVTGGSDTFAIQVQQSGRLARKKEKRLLDGIEGDNKVLLPWTQRRHWQCIRPLAGERPRVFSPARSG